MTDVIAWPPVGLTGWELDDAFPQSRSEGLIGGRSRTSSALRARRVATANVSGIGKDGFGAGYLRMLKRNWAGKPRLVRVQCFSTLWRLSVRDEGLRNSILEWTNHNVDLLWTAGGTDLLWTDGGYALLGVPATVGRWHGVTVSGLPASQIVARPSDQIRIGTNDATQTGLSQTVVRSDENGVATITTDRAEPFTLSGAVSIGGAENVVFEALNSPRAVQGLRGDFGFQWDFREVFEDEYSDGWTEVDPWSPS